LKKENASYKKEIASSKEHINTLIFNSTSFCNYARFSLGKIIGTGTLIYPEIQIRHIKVLSP